MKSLDCTHNCYLGVGQTSVVMLLSFATVNSSCSTSSKLCYHMPTKQTNVKNDSFLIPAVVLAYLSSKRASSLHDSNCFRHFHDFLWKSSGIFRTVFPLLDYSNFPKISTSVIYQLSALPSFLFTFVRCPC